MINKSDFVITRMITDRIGRHEVLSPIYHKKFQFPREEEWPSYQRKGKFPLTYLSYNFNVIGLLICPITT